MSRIPYFSFYPSDFMGGVRGLSAQEVGIYTMILCRIYEENGPVEYHVRRLSAYCGTREATLEKTVDKLVDLGKLTIADGMLSNVRAEAEIAKRAHGLKIASTAGKVSAEKRQQKQSKTPTDVGKTFNHTDTDKSSEANASDASVDFAKTLFDRGVSFLKRNGTKEPQARSVIGKWRKAYQDTDIFDAFAACSKQGATDPIPWITARLQANGKENNHGKPANRSETRLRAFIAGAGIPAGMDSWPDRNPSVPLLARG